MRSKYRESKIYVVLMWLDLVPGTENRSDMATKQIRDTVEFIKTDGILCGKAPFLFESAEVTRILLSRNPRLGKGA